MTTDLISTTNAPADLAMVVSEAQQTILSQKTPPSEIRRRQGKGGMMLRYVDHAYVTRLLNNAFGWAWDFEILETELLSWDGKPFEVRCIGRLTVNANGAQIVKTQCGSQAIEFLRDGSKPVTIGDAYKGAASDAIKKCASLLGIALDLYDSDAPVTKREAMIQKIAALCDNATDETLIEVGMLLSGQTNGHSEAPPQDDTPVKRVVGSPANEMQTKRKYLAELRNQAAREKITYNPPKLPNDMSSLELDAAINAIEAMLNAGPTQGYRKPVEETA